MRISTIIVMLSIASLCSCASHRVTEAEKSDEVKAREQALLQVARAEVVRREPPYWAEGAHLEVASHQNGVWIVIAWGPYPLNTMGDFRWLEISDDGRVVGYRIGTGKDVEWLRSIRMKKRVKDYH